jgi:hypothetical protein
MTGMILHARQPFDECRDARQGPQIRAEAVLLGTPEQFALDTRELPRIEPRLPAQPARRFQPLPAALAPGVIPPMRRLPTDRETPHDRGLRLALREQPRGLEPARFQRGNVPPLPRWRGHASASDRTR